MATFGAHPFSLEGKRILIAGGASGIGASAAAICAGLGAKLILADVSDATPVADKLRREGHQASAASCDVTNRAAVERLVSGAGALDALIVCSGICPFDDWMADDWDEVYERTNAVNVKGTVNCVRAALPRMMERGDGRIVLVGSLAGRSGGLLSGPHYVASKGAVGALVRWFARKGAPRNVLVNGVAPGPVDTGMIAGRDLNLAAVPLRPHRAARGDRLHHRFPMLAGCELRVRRHARCERRGLHVIASRREVSRGRDRSKRAHQATNFLEIFPSFLRPSCLDNT
jgi:NAD(P)-dependent dehydrogenase (short-subunit alcohol dehydrogenase family)